MIRFKGVSNPGAMKKGGRFMYSLQELGKAYTPIHVVGNGRV